MSEYGQEPTAHEYIEKIRQKPVDKMTGKELVFIYQNGSLTLDEKKRLRYLIEKKKSVENASSDEDVSSPLPSTKEEQQLLQDAIAAVNGNYVPPSSEIDTISEVIESRPSPRFSLKAEEGFDAVEALTDGLPSMAPTAREIEAAKDARVPSPRNNSFFYKLRKSFTKIIHEPVFIISIVMLVFMVLFVRPFFVPSGSMRPTLMEGDRILSIAQYFPSGSTFQRGDIVCFTAPNGTVYVKRVIGIGGDHIQISGEKVYVNGEESPYQGTGGVMTSMDIQLADDEYWVMGDNRGNSEDSRFIGPIKADKMISKVIAIYLPTDHATFL